MSPGGSGRTPQTRGASAPGSGWGGRRLEKRPEAWRHVEAMAVGARAGGDLAA